MQILANQAPIGFEAEFVNQRGSTILYRGILLPFAEADDKIDFIYGVINWKQLADQETTDELLLEIEQVLQAASGASPEEASLTAWADGPTDDGVLELVTALDDDDPLGACPAPSFGATSFDGIDETLPPELAEAPSDVEAGEMALADWLATAREFAELALASEDRSHQALYTAIGRAYDFSLAVAVAEPGEFQGLLADAGLTRQERAPLTPVVKLVFGLDYDKTRLAEFVAALGYAHRLGLDRGTLAEHLAATPGGLKGVVAGERRLRREDAGREVLRRVAPRKAVQRRLRNLGHRPLAEVAREGSEFTLLVARRLADGEVVLLGEVGDDVPLLERAAKKLVG
jgi:hypothetical protein